METLVLCKKPFGDTFAQCPLTTMLDSKEEVSDRVNLLGVDAIPMLGCCCNEIIARFRLWLEFVQSTVPT